VLEVTARVEAVEDAERTLGLRKGAPDDDAAGPAGFERDLVICPQASELEHLGWERDLMLAEDPWHAFTQRKG